VLRVVVGMAIGAILTVWVLLVVGVLPAVGRMTLPGFSPTGPVVQNGVAVIVACGKKSGIEGMPKAMDYAPEPRTGTWDPVRKGECTVWYHKPPGPEQRHARRQRARETSH
jgi:hypothetical protein